ncbi:MAG TPA: tRNA lysidine(34) synthetase TilS [Terriglobales bacterium]|nr:tRNA lysidine(34) synthetase TilS [Terriglobales bacterium]HVM91168.1 tRNA lysidine(34) synthetase TilS [Terriglobales bacterium]
MPDLLAQRLLKTIRSHEFLRAGDRVGVAVSGGADSVALLLLLAELRAELGIVLSVAHVNHKLRGAESDEDEAFTKALAARLGLECQVASAPIESAEDARDVRNAKPNIEAAARELRYNFFRKLVERGRANKIATAHTLDDQAETVLLRMFRGTGIRGLAGILPRLSINEPDHSASAEIVRPLLAFRRAELRNYLRARGEGWREDSSNRDPSFTRNRLRQRLLPMIAEEFGDAAIARIADLAEIARAEEEYCADADELTSAKSSEASLDAKDLLALPLAIQRRLVRRWLEKNATDAALSFSLIEEILQLARGEAGRKLELPGDKARSVRRGRAEIVIEPVGPDVAEQYEYSLTIPGTVDVPEISTHFEARLVEAASVSEAEASTLLGLEVGKKLTIRNWRPGDRYWPAHTAREKKVKELLADLHATGAKKKLWPVAVDGKGRIVWMRGFSAPAVVRAGGAKAISIRETPLLAE